MWRERILDLTFAFFIRHDSSEYTFHVHHWFLKSFLKAMLLSINCAFLSSSCVSCFLMISSGTRLVIVKQMRNLAVIHYVSREIEKKYLTRKAIAKPYLLSLTITPPILEYFWTKSTPFLLVFASLPLPLFTFTNNTFQKGRLLKGKF